jgi:hypothetical protein
MLARLAPRLNYANVMATAAVFLALGGGAYAAFTLPKNSVGTKQLKNGAVTNKKLANNAVTGAKVAARSLTGTQIDASTLGTVPNATHASTAANSTHASTADNATHASAADNATHASTADNASHANAADNGVFAFGQIREDGSIFAASSELASVTHTLGSGLYCLVFKDTPPFLALIGSVVSEAGTDPPPTLVPRVTNGQGSDCPGGQLAVRVQDTMGKLTEGRFSFIVP